MEIQKESNERKQNLAAREHLEYLEQSQATNLIFGANYLVFRSLKRMASMKTRYFIQQQNTDRPNI